MGVAYDFSVVPGPDPAALKAAGAEGVLVYSFNSRQSDAYLDECRALGLKVVWIWERNTDSILSANGADECRAHEQSAKPGELTYVACDLNNGALNGRDVIRFCREWAATTREAEFGLYGPQDAIAQAQASGVPKLTKWWGVVNWITGGGPDNAPGNIAYWQGVGAHLVQLIGSPVPNTDQNLILKADWASISGDDDMTKEEFQAYFLDDKPFGVSRIGAAVGDEVAKSVEKYLFEDKPFGVTRFEAYLKEALKAQ